tara:strand:+ start:1949 stop:2542 length:594 start_codon:yes stop_codon:yes gene_type:complete
MISKFIELVQKERIRGMTIAEIGCWTGEMAKLYLPIIEQEGGHAILIAWFKGNVTCREGPHQYRPDKADKVFNELNENISGYLDRVTILRMETYEAAKYIKDETLDICFIDADHRYSSVARDIDLYFPKVIRQGILCGHDFKKSAIDRVGTFSEEELAADHIKNIHCGVVQAVVERFGRNVKLIDDKTTSIWVQRKY